MTTIIYNLSKSEQGGVGRYTCEVLERMKLKIAFNEINLSSSFGENNFGKLLSVIWKRKNFLSEQLNKFSEINHFLQTEIFYSFKGYGKMIVTLHNPPPFTEAISDMYSGYISLFRSALFFNRYKDAVKNADFLIANSEITKDGIIEMGFDEDKVKVIDLGIDEKFRIISSCLDRKNIIGYVGSFGQHKRVGRLLEDWGENREDFGNYNLHLHGYGTQLKNLKNRYNKKFNVIFWGKMPENTLVNVYNSFKAFVFPTKGESFGLPIIEAVACGTPVFIYNDAKITPEVKKYCIEIESISEIPVILENIKMNTLIKKSKDVKKEFNWNKNVDETIGVYESL